MLKREITNKVTYKEKLAEDSYLTNTKYTRKVYFWGIKFLDHQFEEDNTSTIKELTVTKSMGFTKPNKNS